MIEPKELKIGVVVIKDLAKIRANEEAGIDPRLHQGPPEPLIYADRAEHKKFFDKIMAAR